MIVEWLLQLSSWWNGLVAGMMPPADLQGFDPATQTEGWAPLMSWLGGVGYWVNVPALAWITGLALIAYVASLLAKLVRAIISHVPLVGGKG